MTVASEGGSEKPWRHEFLKFCLESEVLRFGDFTLKSGRKSPYFFNAGLFNTGGRLAQVGKYYAAALIEAGLKYDVVFGPAYKGIPLASAAAIALSEKHNLDVPYCFNRKEAKDHGEGGVIVGASLDGKAAIMVDDVMTAGTAAREGAAIIEAAGGTLAGIVILLDRQEKGADTDLSAVQQVQKTFGVPVLSIASLAHLIEFLDAQGRTEDATRLREHQQAYGVSG